MIKLFWFDFNSLLCKKLRFVAFAVWAKLNKRYRCCFSGKNFDVKMDNLKHSVFNFPLIDLQKNITDFLF